MKPYHVKVPTMMSAYPTDSISNTDLDAQGSGTVTILETYRALLASGFKPKNDVEFHWYALLDMI